MKRVFPYRGQPLRAVGSGGVRGVGIAAPRPPAYSLRRGALIAFLAPLLCAAAFVLPFTLANGGIFYVSNDQITQQIPLAQQVVRLIHGGHWLYDFGMDLGTGVVEGYAWYNLGSVFTLVYLLFPAAATPYLMGPVLCLKFACGGLFSYLWMRRYTQTDLAALCGSLLYAFSGAAVTNMVFPFADVYALFPLLPLGMDAWAGGKAPCLFAVAVALNALANPPLFFGAAVFMVLYFAVKCACRAYRPQAGRFLLLCAAAVCGVALGAFLLLPFASALAANPRVGSTLPFGREWFVYIAYRYFELFRSLVLPAEVTHQNALMITPDAVSPEGYLPLFGLVPVFAWILKKRKDWLRTLLILCLFCLFIPFLNSAFSALNAAYYTRWVYMPVLCAALCTALCLEDGGVPLRGGFFVWGGLAAVFAGCMVLWRVRYGYPAAVIHWPLFLVCLALCAAGLALTGRMRPLWRAAPRALVALAAAFGVATGAVNLYANQRIAARDYGPLPQLAQKTIYAGRTTPLPGGPWRLYAPNLSNTYFGHGSPFSFNSTLPAGIFELQAAFGRQRTSISRIEWEEAGLWSLLGVRYLLADSQDATFPLPNVALAAAGQPYSVFENRDALPLIVGFDAVIRAQDADALGNAQKSVAMLHGVVAGDDALAALTAGGLKTLSAESLPQLSYQSGVAARQSMSAADVRLGRAAVTASLTMPQDGAMLITLPYDAGWRCTVDGEAAPLFKAGYGLMAAAVPAGTHQIALAYRPAGGAAGLALSAAGLLGLAALWGFARQKRRRPGPSPASWHAEGDGAHPPPTDTHTS